MITEQGKKFDSDKDRWDLLPMAEAGQVVKVITHGARKYAPNNWQSVEDASNRYYAAAMRHLVAWRSGETLDPESKLPHLAHAICSLFFVFWHDNNKRKKTE